MSCSYRPRIINTNMGIRAMNKGDFLQLILFFEERGFDDYKYRISILIFAVSHDLRPLVGFETKLEDFCLGTEECFNSLNEFFWDRSLNLKVTADPILSIYNTKYSIESLRIQSNEDEVQWFGRIFGYWVPMTEEEFTNYNVTRNTLSIYVNYGGVSNFLTSFDSLEPISIPWDYVTRIRHVYNIIDIPKEQIELNISTRPPGAEDYIVATLYF